MLNPKLLQFICCPRCRGELAIEAAVLACHSCQRQYRSQDGVPILVELANLPPHVRSQVRYFEKDATTRATYRLREWQKSVLRRFVTTCQPRVGEVLVDVGCGTGYMAVEMARKGLQVLACDLALSELIKLKKLAVAEGLEDQLLLVCCGAEELPLKDATADYAVSNALLEHLPQDEVAVKEMARTCRVVSQVLITVPLQLRYGWPFFWPLAYLNDRKMGHLRRYSQQTLARKFGIFGYRTKKTYYSGHFEKVIVVLLYLGGLRSERWERWSEVRDRRKETKRYGSQNICVIFERVPHSSDE